MEGKTFLYGICFGIVLLIYLLVQYNALYEYFQELRKKIKGQDD